MHITTTHRERIERLSILSILIFLVSSYVILNIEYYKKNNYDRLKKKKKNIRTKNQNNLNKLNKRHFFPTKFTIVIGCLIKTILILHPHQRPHHIRAGIWVLRIMLFIRLILDSLTAIAHNPSPSHCFLILTL